MNHCAASHSTGASFFLKKLLNLARKRLVGTLLTTLVSLAGRLTGNGNVKGLYTPNVFSFSAKNLHESGWEQQVQHQQPAREDRKEV